MFEIKKFIYFRKRLSTVFNCRFESYTIYKNINYSSLILGNNIELNDNVHFVTCEKVNIGNDVLIASKVYISNLSHGEFRGEKQDPPLTKPNLRKQNTNPIIIKDEVWID